MPLQITKNSKSIRKRIAVICIYAIVFCMPQYLYADSGAYKTGKHGDPSIGVYHDSNLPRGNCNQCHIQHDSDGPYDFGLFSPSDNGFCQSSGCHEYEYQSPPGDFYWAYPGNVPEWYNSAHGASTSLFPIGGREVKLCLQCHNPHSESDPTNGVFPSATRQLEENGCYSFNGIPGEGCHGFNSANRPFGADDIYTQMLKSTRHNVALATKVHSGDWSTSFPYGREPRTANSGYFSDENWHVECVDCHNPHKATTQARIVGSNNIGGALLGIWGVEPTNGGPWITPSSFVSVDFTSLSAKEYQLCFKCHSYFAFGVTPPSGYTDNAREFNPANVSFHPIEDTIPANSYTSPSSENGFIETMETPWDNNMHDMMVCSDCHSSEIAGEPKGPHGSSQPFLLIASPSVSDNSLCLKCHKATVYAPAFDPGATETGSRFDSQTSGDEDASHYFHVTERGFGCRQCHGARQNEPPASPEQSTPYPIEVGSLHGTNSLPGLMNGANINSYSPGSCTPTCHEHVTYNTGQE